MVMYAIGQEFCTSLDVTVKCETFQPVVKIIETRKYNVTI